MTERFKNWSCTCGWKYHSPIPLKDAPEHRCNPRTHRKKTLRPIKEET